MEMQPPGYCMPYEEAPGVLSVSALVIQVVVDCEWESQIRPSTHWLATPSHSPHPKYAYNVRLRDRGPHHESAKYLSGSCAIHADFDHTIGQLDMIVLGGSNDRSLFQHRPMTWRTKKEAPVQGFLHDSHYAHPDN